MAIDPSIPLAVMVPKTPSFLQTLGDVMTIQDRRLDQSLRVAAAGDQAALGEAMAAHPNDPDAVSQTLQAAGHGVAALKFEVAMAEQRKRHIDTLKAELDLGHQQLEQGMQVVQGIRDQGTLTAAKGYLQKHVPQLAQVLPDVWDEPDEQGVSKARQAVDYLRSVGMKAQEYNAFQKDMLDRLEKRPKTEQEWLTLTGQIMAGATTPELWNIHRGVLRAQGAPTSVLGLVPEQFDPDAPTRMAELGMTPEQRQKNAADAASRARAEATAAETARHNAVTEALGQQGRGIQQQNANTTSARLDIARAGLDLRRLNQPKTKQDKEEALAYQTAYRAYYAQHPDDDDVETEAAIRGYRSVQAVRQARVQNQDIDLSPEGNPPAVAPTAQPAAQAAPKGIIDSASLATLAKKWNLTIADAKARALKAAYDVR